MWMSLFLNGDWHRGAGNATRTLWSESYTLDSHTEQINAMPKAPMKEELKQRLSDEQYHVTQEQGTERAFTGKYWDHKGDGVYRCVVCEEPLFDSDTKFESGSGWPSFYDVVDKGNVELRADDSHGMRRTEVVCGNCGAHLGHLFDDGPNPTGKRYCINSASLDFEGE